MSFYHRHFLTANITMFKIIMTVNIAECLYNITDNVETVNVTENGQTSNAKRV